MRSVFKPSRRFSGSFFGAPAVPPPPGAMASLAATATGPNSITLAYTGPGGLVDSYNIYRSTTPGVYGAPIASDLATPYVDSGLASDTVYYYKVAAVNAGGEGPLSSEVTAQTVPGAPTGLAGAYQASPVGCVLTWAKSNSAITQTFRVQRAAASGGPWTTIASGIAALTYTDETALNGTRYFYQVRGENTAGNGAYSSELDFPMPVAAPPQPQAGRPSTTTLTMQMVAATTLVTGAAYYRAQYRDATVNGAWQNVETSPGVPKQITAPGQVATTPTLILEHVYELRFQAVSSLDASTTNGTLRTVTLTIAVNSAAVPTPSVYDFTTSTAKVDLPDPFPVPGGYFPAGVDGIRLQIRGAVSGTNWRDASAEYGASPQTITLTGFPDEADYTDVSAWDKANYYYARWLYRSGSTLTAGNYALFKLVPEFPDDAVPDSVSFTTATFTLDNDFVEDGVATLTLQLQKSGTTIWTTPTGGQAIEDSNAPGDDFTVSNLLAATTYTPRWYLQWWGGVLYSDPGAPFSTDGAVAPDDLGDWSFDVVSGTWLQLKSPEMPAHATGMKLYRKGPGDVSFVLQETILAADTPVGTRATIIQTGLTTDEDYLYYWEAYNGVGSKYTTETGVHTLEFDLPGVPTQPGSPTFVSKTPTSIKVQQPSTWPADTLEMWLYRNNVRVHKFTALHGTPSHATNQFDDTGLTPGQSYTYTVYAKNNAGLSPVSTALVVSLVSEFTLSFVAPDAGELLRKLTDIVVQAEDGATLDENDPVVITLLGAPLTPIAQNVADPLQFSAPFDPRTFNWSGELTFAAYLIDEDGFHSATVYRTIEIDNSLLGLVRWGDAILTEAEGLRITSVEAAAVILPSSGSSDNWFQFGIRSPAGNDYAPVAPTEAELLALEDDYRLFQKIALDADVPVTGARNLDGTYVPSDNTLMLRIREAPKSKWTNYLLGGSGLKMRRVANGTTLEIYCLEGGKLWQFTDDDTAPVLRYTLSDYGVLSGLTDFALNGDKIHCVIDGALKRVDLSDGDSNLFETIDTEGRPVKFVETLATGDTANTYWITSDATNGTRIYRRNTDNARSMVTLDEECVCCYSNGNALLLGLANGEIRLYLADATTTTLLATHSQAPTFVQSTADGWVFFGDADGNLWGSTTAGTPASLAQIEETGSGIELRGAVRIKAGADVFRVATGGDSENFYVQDEETALYVAAKDFGSSSIVLQAMERMVWTITPANTNDDPNNGGTAAIEDESLFVLVNDPDGAYLARWQQTAKPHSAYEGRALRWAGIVPTGLAVAD